MNKYLIEFPEDKTISKIFNKISDCLCFAESLSHVNLMIVYSYREFNYPKKLTYGIYYQRNYEWYWAKKKISYIVPPELSKLLE